MKNLIERLDDLTEGKKSDGLHEKLKRAIGKTMAEQLTGRELERRDREMVFMVLGQIERKGEFKAALDKLVNVFEENWGD